MVFLEFLLTIKDRFGLRCVRTILSASWSSDSGIVFYRCLPEELLTQQKIGGLSTKQLITKHFRYSTYNGGNYWPIQAVCKAYVRENPPPKQPQRFTTSILGIWNSWWINIFPKSSSHTLPWNWVPPLQEWCCLLDDGKILLKTCVYLQPTYCWWLKSCTTWDVWNPINNGIHGQTTNLNWWVCRISGTHSIQYISISFGKVGLLGWSSVWVGKRTPS